MMIIMCNSVKCFFYVLHNEVLWVLIRVADIMLFLCFSDNTSKITMYDLIAVICHHGTAGGRFYNTLYIII